GHPPCCTNTVRWWASLLPDGLYRRTVLSRGACPWRGHPRYGPNRVRPSYGRSGGRKLHVCPRRTSRPRAPTNRAPFLPRCEVGGAGKGVTAEEQRSSASADSG